MYAANNTATSTWTITTATPPRYFLYGAAVAMPAFGYIVIAGGYPTASLVNGTQQVDFFDVASLSFIPQPTVAPPTTPPPTTASPATTQPFPCPGSPPADNATCDVLTGQWVLPDASTPPTINITDGQVLVINGSLLLPDDAQVIINSGSTGGAPIVVSGTAGLGGTLVLVLPSVPDTGDVLPVIQAENFTGNFSGVVVKQPDACYDVQGDPRTEGGLLSVLFTVRRTCKHGGRGLSKGAIAGIVVGAVLGLAIAIGVGLLVVRRKLPHHKMFKPADTEDGWR